MPNEVIKILTGFKNTTKFLNIFLFLKDRKDKK